MAFYMVGPAASLYFVQDPDLPPTPTLYYLLLLALYIIFLLVNHFGAAHVKDHMSPLALFIAKTIPLTAVILPFAIICFADQGNGLAFMWAASMSRTLAGCVCLITGKWISKSTNASVQNEGKGTLSPITKLQTQKLVVTGLYAHVRNPMIMGVAIVMVGLSLLAGSVRFFAYVIYFMTIKTLWFIVSEEPSMLRRFGVSYEEYKANVPRWVPRRSPYQLKATME
eukprot:scaffold1174_cov281-Chaetoceros_neogracile.AAC.26